MCVCVGAHVCVMSDVCVTVTVCTGMVVAATWTPAPCFSVCTLWWTRCLSTVRCGPMAWLAPPPAPPLPSTSGWQMVQKVGATPNGCWSCCYVVSCMVVLRGLRVTVVSHTSVFPYGYACRFPLPHFIRLVSNYHSPFSLRLPSRRSRVGPTRSSRVVCILSVSFVLGFVRGGMA
jgi:hypothetical protein